MHHDIPLGRLVAEDPAAAASEIRRIYAEAGASRRRAASAIGCSRWTLKRWIKMLGISGTLAAIRSRAERLRGG